ncbi:hypothetical protein L798_01853 [Zootermopsis nevadensis]|uniref:Uncharacterized protein n=1 Tax=Zootermopsis nevadensis TaxID=136037 RepID=A0A067RF50_ZOONE|nr:hypothetical protein L798_01853 [Zootermopsis nevadensis]
MQLISYLLTSYSLYARIKTSSERPSAHHRVLSIRPLTILGENGDHALQTYWPGAGRRCLPSHRLHQAAIDISVRCIHCVLLSGPLNGGRILILSLCHVHHTHLNRNLSCLVDKSSRRSCCICDVTGHCGRRLLRSHPISVQRSIL